MESMGHRRDVVISLPRRRSRDKPRRRSRDEPRRQSRDERDNEAGTSEMDRSASKMIDTPSYWSTSGRLGTVHFGAPFTLVLHIIPHSFFVLLSN